MSPLRQQMHDAMLVRGLALRTRETYIEAVAKLARFYHAGPERLPSGQRGKAQPCWVRVPPWARSAARGRQAFETVSDRKHFRRIRESTR